MAWSDGQGGSRVDSFGEPLVFGLAAEEGVANSVGAALAAISEPRIGLKATVSATKIAAKAAPTGAWAPSMLKREPK